MKLHPSILAILDRSANVDTPTYLVTPRMRLARQLREAYNYHSKTRTWNDSPIVTIGGAAGWVAHLANPLLTTSGMLLISEGQARLIWEDTLWAMPDQDKELIGWDTFADESGIMTKRFIAQAQDAWRLAHLYRLEFAPKNFNSERMPRFFYRWSLAYQKMCEKRRVTDEWMALLKICAALTEGTLSPPASVWVGFNDNYPAYEELYRLLTKHASSKTTKQENAFVLQGVTDVANDELQCQLSEYDNEREEMSQLAAIVSRTHKENPTELIGVVIPGLEKNWHYIRRLFAIAFSNTGAVSENPNPTQQEALPFDMSWGEELREYPLIGDMLTMLSITPAKIPPPEFADVFHSPYLAGYEREEAARAALRQRFINLNAKYRSISLQELTVNKPQGKMAASKDGKILDDTPLLKEALHKYFNVEDAFVKSATPQHWAQTFSRQIHSLGWGDIKWSRLEKQLWEKWEGILDQLYSAGNILSNCTRARALSFIVDCAAEIFQASPAATKVRLLGIKQAEGLIFDRLFACQMNDACLSPPAANFFIPFELGRAASMKWCSLAQRWCEEERIIGGLMRAAPVVNFSFAARSEEEEKLPHPLLGDILIKPPIETSLSSTREGAREGVKEGKIEGARQKEVSISWQELNDEQAPAVAKDEELKSLVSIVKSQSSCPFQAFAAHRLKPAVPEPPQDEVSAMDRGTMLHKVLRNVWSKIESQQRLCDMEDGEVIKLVAAESSRVLHENIWRIVFLQDEMTTELEKKYLATLTQEFLHNEKQRKIPFRVAGLEKEIKVNLEGREFLLKIDRIDEILPSDNSDINKESHNNGTRVLIDYKVGNANHSGNSIRGLRPREPQLIIYSLVTDDLRSLGFIALNLKNGSVAKGLCLGDDGLFHQVRSVIKQEQLQQMQQNVRDIYASFISGRAAVDPLDAAVCRYCQYDSLCRIQEINSLN